MYPIKFKDEIRVSSGAFDVDPFLVTAIIRVESNFKPGVSSPKGAFGLMQLMPDTAEWMVEAGHFQSGFLERLEEPTVNIHMGSWYIGQLLKQFGMNSPAAIAAYNAGPGRVEEWLSTEQWNGKRDTIADIPFGETRQYVQKVLYYYEKYRNVYPELGE